MLVEGVAHRAVEWHQGSGCVCWIDQRLLPFRFEKTFTQDPEDLAKAIETMAVRGAPTIGAAAAYGLALAGSFDRSCFFKYWLPRFRRTRPTAVNLFHACDVLEQAVAEGLSGKQLIELANDYADREVRANRRIGEIMAEYLARGGQRILTHCNAGWLAAVDWGTATAGMYTLHREGERLHVWVDETRPRLQGSRLTAWEMVQEGLSCALLADGAAAWMMSRGEVDAIVVGADRIARNGDVANKIGTYALSLAASEHGIPMYVAAPSSTFDMKLGSGRAIPIEERGEEELLEVEGMDEHGSMRRVRLAAQGIGSCNPAFDVTPFQNVTAIISEQGVFIPDTSERLPADD
ncbi:MAG: S-methyl-5-thioribose-1-phosphate isomerase [Zetaproteobacteria bacterium]|nr:MAG: S-methyl-5-thioribose-1-phosphate isomerase [Zetaproteobacteria bacterium]